MTMIQSIIGTAFAGGGSGSNWPPGVDPNGAVYEITGNAQQGLWKRHYPYYFADDIAGLIAAIPDFQTADGSFSINGDSEDNFSVMWTGYLQAPASGDWKFRTTSDDSSYFWIGADALTGTSISNVDINNGGLHGSTTVEMTTPVTLIGGYYYPIRAMFGESNGAEVFSIEWNQDNTSWSNVNMAYSRYNAANTTDGF